ncbi:hypothetical protein ACOMHN_033017 [Nucella lapillus]
MIVYPEHIDATCSETVVTMTSLPTPKSSPPYDVRLQIPARLNDESGGAIEEVVTSQRLEISAGPSPLPQRTDCEVIQRDQTDSPVARMDSAKAMSFEDVTNEVKVIKRVEHRLRNPSSVGPGTIEDCSKLVNELSKELALLHGLSQGIGVDADCPKLRQQLHLAQRRACSLARCNSTSLVPLVRRKTSLPSEQVVKVEKLYRIYSGSLEYLLYLLRKVHTLLCKFHPDKDTCLFIRTGITEPADISCKAACNVHKAEESYLHRPEEGSATNSVLEKGGDSRISGDIRSMQQLFYMVTNACDTHPWHVGEEEGEGAEGGGERRRGGDVGEGPCQQPQQQENVRTRVSAPFRLSVKRQSRRSTGRTSSKAATSEEGEENGRLLDETATEPQEVTRPPGRSGGGGGKRCCVGCLALCGLRGKDQEETEDLVEVVDSSAETGPLLENPAVHIVVTDCVGQACSVDQ